MGLLEDELRDMFAGQVTRTPSLDGVADRAIRGAARARQRTTVAVVAAALCVAAVAYGVMASVGSPSSSITPGQSGTTSPAPTTTSPEPSGVNTPVEVLAGTTLYQTGGTKLSMAGVPGTVDRAWRVTEGYLVDTYDPGTNARKLWLVPPSGPATMLISGQGQLLVARGSDAQHTIRVSWTANNTLYVGTYAAGAVMIGASTSQPQLDVAGLTWKVPLYPEAFAGDTLVVAGTDTGGGLSHWDDWYPSRGTFVYTDHPTINTVLGVTADGSKLIAIYAGTPGDKGSLRLGEFDPDGFILSRSLAPIPAALNGTSISASPDGRWLFGSWQDQAAIFDANLVWSGAQPVWSGQYVGGNPVWIGNDSVAVTNGTTVQVLHTDGRAPEQVPLPAIGSGDSKYNWLVPDLR